MVMGVEERDIGECYGMMVNKYGRRCEEVIEVSHQGGWMSVVVRWFCGVVKVVGRRGWLWCNGGVKSGICLVK